MRTIVNFLIFQIISGCSSAYLNVAEKETTEGRKQFKEAIDRRDKKSIETYFQKHGEFDSDNYYLSYCGRDVISLKSFLSNLDEADEFNKKSVESLISCTNLDCVKKVTVKKTNGCRSIDVAFCSHCSPEFLSRGLDQVSINYPADITESNKLVVMDKLKSLSIVENQGIESSDSKKTELTETDKKCIKADYGLLIMASYSSEIKLSNSEVIATTLGPMRFICRNENKFKNSWDVNQAIGVSGVVVQNADRTMALNSCRVAYLKFLKFDKYKNQQGFDVKLPVWQVVSFESFKKKLGIVWKDEAPLISCGR